MIREGVWLSVISTGRPGNVAPMRALVGDATWYVRPGDEYEAETVAVDSLVGARNAALEDAFARGLPCVQVSDDLMELELLRSDGVTPASFPQIVKLLREEIGWTDFRLAGCAPTSNAFYASLKVKRRHFIVGDLILVLPSPQRFDPALRLKEDYDFTAQHIAAYGGVCRVDWILASFKHRTNPGGAVADRTPELEQTSIAYLKQRWPRWIRDNPKRPNEILFRA